MSLKDELKQRVARREKLKSDLERLKGRKEQLQHELRQLEESCRQKGYEPSDLPSILKEKHGVFKDELSRMDTQLDAFESSLKPFLREI